MKKEILTFYSIVIKVNLKLYDGLELINMEKLFELDEILSSINKQENYFISFLNTKGIEAGILKLSTGQEDTQAPHSIDELYFVIEGNGFIEINDTTHVVKKGTIIFVPAESKHRFYDNDEDIIVLYVFGG
jgi:mannose-6-phosphate isomerase-like protein (cupin superfamily)